jgi:chromosome segregation ATPase
MPYSMDSEANKTNSSSPSSVLAVENQLIYKIAAMEATISNSLRRLDEKFDRLQLDLHDRYADLSKDIGMLSGRVESHEQAIQNVKDKAREDIASEAGKVADRVDALERWKTAVVTRFSVVCAVIMLFWALFGRSIQDYIQGVLHIG